MATPIQYNAYGSEYATDQASIDRQRQLAQALQTQSMQPLGQDAIGGVAIRRSPLEGLAQLGKAYAGSKVSERADAKEKELAKTYAQGLADTLKAAQADPGNAEQYYMQHPLTQPLGISLAEKKAQQGQWAALLGAGGPSVSPAGAAAGAQPVAPLGQAAGSQAPAASNLLQESGITRQEATAALLADPSGKLLSEKILAARAEANKPVVNRGYGVGRMINGQYVPDQASLEQALALERGKAGIVDVQKGAEFYDKTGHDLPGFAQGKPAQGAMPPQGMPQQGQPPVNPQLAGLPPQMAAAIQADMARTGTQNANFRIGPTDAPAGTPIAPQNIQQGQIGQAPMQAPVAPPVAAATPGISPTQQREVTTAEERSLAEHRGQTLASQEEKIQHDADSAIQKIAQNNKMVELIPSITTGGLAKQITTLRGIGQSLGINIGDPSSNQEFEKFAIKGALEGAKQIYGARLTNQDVMSQIASNPGSSMAEKALYQLIKYDNIQQQRNIDKRQAYFQYQGPKNQFGQWFDQTHPFMGIAAPGAGQTAAQSAPALEAPKTNPAVKRYNPATGKIE